MPQANYHQHHGGPILLEVIKTHTNGTVDLQAPGGAQVTSVPVSETPNRGYAVLLKETPAATEAKAATKAKPPATE